jgi:hypothetical protein
MKTIGLFAVACLLAFNATSPAGLQLTVNGVSTNYFAREKPGVVWIGIENDASDDQYNAAIILTNHPHWSEWTGESRLNRPLGMAQGWDYFGPTEGIGDVWFAWFAQPVVDKLPAGIIGEVAFFVMDGDEGLFTLTDDSLNIIDTLTVTAVPEPATLALFGLGVMMIRRKHSA